MCVESGSGDALCVLRVGVGMHCVCCVLCCVVRLAADGGDLQEANIQEGLHDVVERELPLFFERASSSVRDDAKFVFLSLSLLISS